MDDNDTKYHIFFIFRKVIDIELSFRTSAKIR